MRFKASRDLPPAAEGIESPYDVEARYRHKHDTQWTGYMVHVSETCDPTAPHLLTHVHTTPATVHEAQCTEPSSRRSSRRAYHHRSTSSMRPISVRSCSSTAATTRASPCGAPRPSQGWQMQVEGAYTVEQFAVDWDQQQGRCPQGHLSVAWWEHGGGQGSRPIMVEFDKHMWDMPRTAPLYPG